MNTEITANSSKEDFLTLGFDIGTGSLGCAVCLGNKIIHTRVYLFHPEFAAIAGSSSKRRMARTRTAHRAREYLLNQICQNAGIPVLKKIERINNDFRVTETDPRLKREFASADDDTVYTSCLLRILILDGKIDHLEPWQIYKALHSAIQRRGYGSVPWAKSANNAGKESEKDELENRSRSQQLEEELRKITSNEKFHFVPYFTASKMKLWTPENGIIRRNVNHEAERAALLEGLKFQGITASRSMIESELKLLLTQTKKRFPKINVETTLYGLHEAPFSSLAELSNTERLNYTREWQGILGQKIPRFDNRILASCALIPRLHVARSIYEKNPLHSETHLLLALHRLRPLDKKSLTPRSLTPDELRKIFEDHMRTQKEENPTFKFTKTQLSKALSEFELVPSPTNTDIPPPKTTGRSRFSRPGAFLLKKLILSGLPPKEFLLSALSMPCSPKSEITIEANQDSKIGLTKADLRWIEIIQDQSWNKIYVPDVGASTSASMSDILKDLKHPVVRHRIEFFAKVLKDLQHWSSENLGRSEPDRVVIELVREKLSERKKSELETFNKQRKKERDQAQVELGANTDPTLTRKYMMAKVQGWRNLFPASSGALQRDEFFQTSDLIHYDIEHILPRSKGGPDAFWNMILCPHHLNREKGDRTPRDWLSNDPERWQTFCNRVAQAKDLHPKTKKLLLSSLEEAQELSESYTQLAGTAWIARLSRKVTFATLNWPENQGNGQKVYFANGGLTAKLRRKYRLNTLLNPDGNDKKNRDSPLHHALDACVIALTEQSINPKITPESLESIHSQIFSTQLINTGPKPSLLEENFYGKRRVQVEDHDFDAIVWRVEIPHLAMKQVEMKEVFSIEQLETNIKRIYPTPTMNRDLPVRQLLIDKLENLRLSDKPAETWEQWCKKLLAKPGPKKVTLFERIPDKPNEYKELDRAEAGSPNEHVKQILKPKGSHVGQYVYSIFDNKRQKKYLVRPLYVHESRPSVEMEIKNKDGEIIFFVRSGDFLVLPEGTKNGKIEPGTYRLNSLQANGQIQLTTILGEKIKYYPMINQLIELGLHLT